MGLPAFLTPIIGPAINKLLDRIPNGPERARAQEDLEEKILMGVQAANAAQNDVNKAQAQHKSIFVAGARPAEMWICATALGWNYVLYPILLWVGFLMEIDLSGAPKLDGGELTALLSGMLGFGGMRTVEKIKKVARDVDPKR